MIDRPLDRRRLLQVLAVSLAPASCTVGGGEEGPEGRRPTASPSAAPPALPAGELWVPPASESLPRLKQTAAAFVQALGTRAAGETLEDVIARATPHLAPGVAAAALRRVAAPLHEERASSAVIDYAQYSGLSPIGPGARTAGVMVLLRQRLLTRGGRIAEVVRACDVRLSVVARAWRVTSLMSIGGQPVARPASLPPLAERLLASKGLSLPDTARWDLYAGRVAPALLDVLQGVLALGPASVSVFRNGHPQFVFGTTRTSDHFEGRAVDLWRVGGVRVAENRTLRSPWARAQIGVLRDPRVRQVGSPPGSDRDGRRRQSFANLVHDDHVHIAVRSSA